MRKRQKYDPVAAFLAAKARARRIARNATVTTNVGEDMRTLTINDAHCGGCGCQGMCNCPTGASRSGPSASPRRAPTHNSAPGYEDDIGTGDDLDRLIGNMDPLGDDDDDTDDDDGGVDDEEISFLPPPVLNVGRGSRNTSYGVDSDGGCEAILDLPTVNYAQAARERMEADIGKTGVANTAPKYSVGSDGGVEENDED
jgi:hypothetical protein